MNRIRRLLRAPDEPRCAAGPALSICLALGVFCALAVAQQGGPAGALAKSGSPSTPYGKWLTEDVAYIIAEEEQNAFERLETDPERDRFIEQFWERRDPTPASPENEFKQEHYRRIAYANSRFPASDTAGWQTDRGRIYIAYGPPDEIESHPSGGTIQRMRAGRREQAASANPFEIWRYRSIEGLGVDILLEFVDVDRSGDYRLTGDALVGGRAAQ